MPPRNLTWEEEVEDKTKAITTKRLELRMHLRNDKQLRQLKLFKKNLILQFHLKNQEIRENKNLRPSEVNDEIGENLEMIEELETNIKELEEKIKASTEKESDLCGELFHLKEDLRKIIRQNTQN